MLKASRAILPRLRNLFITTETTPNPNALKFVPGRDVLGAGSTCDFPDIREAYKSPLAKRIFAVDGVKGKQNLTGFLLMPISAAVDFLAQRSSL